MLAPPEPGAGPLRPRTTVSAETARLRWKWHFAALRFEAALRNHLRALKAYDPNQPRVPAGNPEGGQWTAGEQGQHAPVRLAQLTGTLSDIDGTPYYKPGGHHEMSKAIYGKWDLRPETRRVFEQATTGKLPSAFLRTTPDGVPIGNFWNGPNGAHHSYNQAVQELADRFLQENNITPESMTPNEARALLKEIRESRDPRIRDFNNGVRFLRRLFRLRGGRGNE